MKTPPKSYNPRFNAPQAYKLLLEGKTEAFLRNKFSDEEIRVALNYRDNYQKRDMLISVLSKEMKVSPGIVKEFLRCKESVKR